MITDYDPRYKLLRLLVKEQFLNEGLDVPERILPPTALPLSDPREMFLIRILSILLEQLESMLRKGLNETDEYKQLNLLYTNFRKERYEVCE